MPRAFLPAVLLAALISACDRNGSGPTLTPGSDVLAATFASTADSLNRNGDSLSGGVFGMAAAVLRAGITPTALSVSENGTLRPWFAVAQRYDVSQTSCTTAIPIPTGNTLQLPPIACGLAASPVVFAWSATDPRRMLVITAPDGASSVGFSFPTDSLQGPTGVISRPTVMTSATLLDPSSRSVRFARVGEVSISRPASTVPCERMIELPAGATGSCARGDYRAGFNLSMTGGLVTGADSSGATLSLVLPVHVIAGVVVRLTNAGPPVTITIPPRSDSTVTIPPTIPGTPVGSLESSLDVIKSDTGVTFTFRVRNHTDRVQSVVFPSSQRMDLRVQDGGAATFGVWSADKAFLQVLSVDTLSAGATRAWSVTWTPARRGSWRAVGMLASSSHRAEASAGFTVP
jgi:hypothetical protein